MTWQIASSSAQTNKSRCEDGLALLLSQGQDYATINVREKSRGGRLCQGIAKGHLHYLLQVQKYSALVEPLVVED